MPAAVANARTYEGEDEAVEGLVPWLNEQTANPENESTETRFALYYFKGAKESLLSVYNHDAGDDFQELAEEIVGEACKDADTRKGKSKFLVRPLKGREGEIPRAKGRHQFSITVNSEYDDELDFSDAEIEEATPKGIVAQNQRHTEKAYKTVLESVQITQGFNQRTLERLERMNDALTEENRTLKEDYEKVMSMNQQRELEYKRFEAEQSRKDQLTAMAVGLIPILLQHFLTQAAGGATQEAAVKFKNFAMSLLPQQLAALKYALSAEQQALLQAAVEGAQQPAPAGGLMGMLMGALGSGGDATPKMP